MGTAAAAGASRNSLMIGTVVCGSTDTIILCLHSQHKDDQISNVCLKMRRMRKQAEITTDAQLNKMVGSEPFKVLLWQPVNEVITTLEKHLEQLSLLISTTGQETAIQLHISFHL